MYSILEYKGKKKKKNEKLSAHCLAVDEFYPPSGMRCKFDEQLREFGTRIEFLNAVVLFPKFIRIRLRR